MKKINITKRKIFFVVLLLIYYILAFFIKNAELSYFINL